MDLYYYIKDNKLINVWLFVINKLSIKFTLFHKSIMFIKFNHIIFVKFLFKINIPVLINIIFPILYFQNNLIFLFIFYLLYYIILFIIVLIYHAYYVTRYLFYSFILWRSALFKCKLWIITFILNIPFYCAFISYHIIVSLSTVIYDMFNYSIA